MKANLRCGAMSLLLVVACNRPDSDLFGADPSPSSPSLPSVGGSSATGGVTSNTSNAGSTGGAVTGGTPTTPALGSGGSAPSAGNAQADSTAGTSNPPDLPDEPDLGGAAGAGGSGEPSMPPAPVCGNGILEAGEQCDDAGHTGRDGCDASCKVECGNFGSSPVESDDHHCYVGYDSASFERAQADCVDRGGHLVTISSAAENKVVRGMVNSSKWIGGTEDVSESSQGNGDYEWVTGEPFSYTNWAAREPNQGKVRCGNILSLNQNCYEHCISMDGEGLWSDARCDVADGYVCEWDPAGTAP